LQNLLVINVDVVAAGHIVILRTVSETPASTGHRSTDTETIASRAKLLGRLTELVQRLKWQPVEQDAAA